MHENKEREFIGEKVSVRMNEFWRKVKNGTLPAPKITRTRKARLKNPSILFDRKPKLPRAESEKIRRSTFKLNGGCSICGKERESGFRMCLSCRLKYNIRNRLKKLNHVSPSLPPHSE